MHVGHADVTECTSGHWQRIGCKCLLYRMHAGTSPPSSLASSEDLDVQLEVCGRSLSLPRYLRA